MKLRTNFAKLVVSIVFKGKLKYYRILQEIGVCEIRHVLSALLSSNSVNWRGAVGDCPVRKVPRRITAEFAAIPLGSNLWRITDRRCSLALDLRLIAVIPSG